jgi:hypothetical protein
MFWPLNCAGNVGSSKRKRQKDLFGIRIYLSLYILTFLLSTDIQNWHDQNAFQLHNSTGQYEMFDMSHEACISRSLLLHGLMGHKGSEC